MVFADAAGPNEKGTQGGRIYCMTDLAGKRIAGFAHWESKKNYRVCRSTSTAEVLTVGDGLTLVFGYSRSGLKYLGRKFK